MKKLPLMASAIIISLASAQAKADLMLPLLIGAGAAYAIHHYGPLVEGDEIVSIEQFSSPEMHHQAGKEMIASGDAIRGEMHLARAAEMGSLQAAYDLSAALLSRNDYVAGQKYLIQAAHGGHDPAIREIAKRYEQGTGGLEKNHKLAFVYWYELAKKGDGEAMHSVAYAFARGLHGVKSDTAAAYWYHRAATKAKYKDSMLAYSWMAENGVGTELNQDESDWYARAGNQKKGAK